MQKIAESSWASGNRVDVGGTRRERALGPVPGPLTAAPSPTQAHAMSLWGRLLWMTC